MIFSFIGMSGVGKSLLSRKLARECGISRFGIDEIIEKKLVKHLGLENFQSQREVSSWIGMPWEEGSKKREDLYLKYENEVMAKVLEEACKKQDLRREDVVIDTAGSVVHCKSEIINILQEKTKPIYLIAGNKTTNDLFENYLRDPRPLVWDNFIDRSKDELSIDLLSAYVNLLSFRQSRYKEISKMCINAEEMVSRSGKEFLELLRNTKP